jgi:molecular chaperone DnaJ
MAAKDYYAILGVSRTSAEKDIKAAYRRLARKYHPDVNPGDKSAEERFKEIAEAYEVLSSPDTRRKYDQYGHLGEGWRHVGDGGFPPPGGGTRPGAGQGYFNQEDLRFETDYSDILGNIFGGQGPRFRRSQAPMRGEDLQYEVELTLEEAALGTERAVTLSVHESCATCRGAGSVSGRACPTCHGTGSVEVPRTLTVRIPRGVKEGAKIRLAGKGGAGMMGGPAGDLFLLPRIAPHPRFERKGDDLYTEVPVTFPEAALGAEVEVPTLQGTVTARVPAGTSSGQSLRLRGKGMPRWQAEGHGDLYVKVRIVTPRDLSEHERELIEELSRLRPETPRG